MRKVLLITALVAGLYMTLVWVAGSVLHLPAGQLRMLQTVLTVLGLVAAGVAIWFFWAQQKKTVSGEFGGPPSSAGGGHAAGADDDIDFLIRDAESKLSGAQVEKGGRLANLPAIFIIGEPGAAKTSTVQNSGIEPELLAGQVYDESSLIPTRALNVWYAQKAIFVEAAGKSVTDPGIWAKLAGRLQPGRLGSVVSKEAPPRAALVMLDAESLTRPGATEALAATARTLRSRLGEISQTLGVNLPVYVLFSKMDRVPFFAEYVRNLTNEESSQVLGVTVPVKTTGGGVYAEEETARLSVVFEQLFRSLCNARPVFLSREGDAVKLPGIYEFPREFRKLRRPLVQFLVDLCRPSQLTVGPFLRGFYFSGVRPVVVTDFAQAPVAPSYQQGAPADATRVFRAEPTPAAPPPRIAGSKRVPQWVFLTAFFHRILLSDRIAMGASGSSTKTSLLRRILLASAAAVCLLYSILLIVSFVKNRGLENTVKVASQGIETVEAASGLKPASLDSLQRLETLRISLARLTKYRRDGAPWSYHWGLYTGDDLYPEVRRIYFANFRKVLFGQTQTTLVDTMTALPATPGPEYAPTYDTLKAYLITTSEFKRSTQPFLSPVLMNRWSATRNVDAERSALAQKQFDFYSDELRYENPYSTENDTALIEKARKYLNQFAGDERVYAGMLADAGKNSQPVNFNRMFPGSAETVIDGYEVAAPFVKPGWDFMRKSLSNPERYFAGEQWVLGDRGAAQIDRAGLSKRLSDRYNSDFVKQWRAYMKAAVVVKYPNLKEAAKKLNVLSGNQSPLLELFSLASSNTSVDVPEVAKLFQPVQAVVPPGGANRLIQPPNQDYIGNLATLQTTVEAAANAPQLTDAVAQPTLTNAVAARLSVKKVGYGLNPDPEAHVDAIVQKLMEDPITSVEALLRGVDAAELNAAGKAFCGQWHPLIAKYPFTPSATNQATIADVNTIFHRPEGALWAFYDSKLQKLLTKQGSQYVAAEGGSVKLTPAFVSFFNRAAAFGDAIYAGNTPEPHLSYSLKSIPSESLPGGSLRLDGQTLTYSGNESAKKDFVWQGSGAHEAKATVKMGGQELGWANKDGLWAIFQFFWQAETVRPSSNGNTFEWVARVGKDPLLYNGNPVTVRFEVDMAGGPPVFQKGYLTMSCIAEVAKQ